MKKITTKTLAIIAAVILITGCITQAPEPEAASSPDASAPEVSAEMSAFNTAWNAADSKRKDAAKIGAEWRDTGKILKKAKAEAKAGNMEKATTLVTQAHEQSRDAILQHARETGQWRSRVPGSS